MTEPTHDLIVLGTGAAGLAAAVTAAVHGLDVGLYEAGSQVGGTTAWSGGHVWVPNNPHQAAVGAEDSMEEAFTYVMSLSRGLLREDLVRSYLEAAPDMVTFLDENAGTEFYAVPDFPDYHPEHPGGKPGGGRTIECPLFPFDELGAWSDRVTPSPYFPNRHLTMSETTLGAVHPVLPTKDEIARRKERDERGMGQALVGRLLKACLDHGIQPHTGHRARELLLDDGHVRGVLLEGPQGGMDVRARHGVVLATGGFEWNEEFKRAFLRGPLTMPVSPRTNVGDGLRMAMRAGAMLGNMREAWWIPAADLPEGVNSMNTALVNGDRTRPRSIMVNRAGRRFTNEAANYNAFGGAFHQEDVSSFGYANLPCWLVFDHEYLRRYGSLTRGPSEVPPPWLRGYDSLAALAEDLGIDAEGLTETVARWNVHAEEGHDPDFGRGESAHDRWWGDPAHKGDRLGTLGPVDTAPYYALEIKPGALGTKGGPQTDGHGRVLDLDGDVLPGLYAAGNAMASVFGMTYGGAGGTLGPALVFGYQAALHAASQHHG